MAFTSPQNRLLAALPPAELQRLQPQLAWTELPGGTLLHEAGRALTHVHFPVSAVVSLTSTMQDGASAEIAVVGSEGVVGVAAFMGGGCSPASAEVQTGGWGWRMPARALEDAARSGSALLHVLLRYTQKLFTQMAQISACSRHHALDEQLCRWLLLHLDRQPGLELAATQERIAQLLGVRREGITCAALKLQREGLIRYGRGRITVLDRAALEARSCECHAAMRSACEPAPHFELQAA
jgi:CRP-like cAMP-binding protein